MPTIYLHLLPGQRNNATKGKEDKIEKGKKNIKKVNKAEEKD